MQIVFHSRNADLAEDFRGIAKDKLESLLRFGVKLDEIKVEIKHEANPHHGKSSHLVVLTTHGSGPFIRADGEGVNDLAAFDKAVEAIELQIRKLHERDKEYARETLREKTVNE